MSWVKTDIEEGVGLTDDEIQELVDMIAEGKYYMNEICGIDSMDHYDSQGMRENGEIVCYDYGDSKKTYSKRLAKDLSIREWVATKGGDELKEKNNEKMD